ncbi:MAG: sigma-70 family RNA polymerase sigma factor [Acidobacteria bacterium]|nr:sigma-70 family RNA polymerase sigma factor [Acidobacteriota bacterium]
MTGPGERRIIRGGAVEGLDKTAFRAGPYKRNVSGRSLTTEELYERHGEGLYRYLLFKLGSVEDAEDTLQECFCRFARYDLRWRLVRDVRAFVFRVARNEADRSLRRKLGRCEGERMIASGAAQGFAAAIAAPEEPALALLLRRAGELPAEQREAVYLKVFDGLTFKEIASVSGVSVNTAASRYRYGIDKLREALGGKP